MPQGVVPEGTWLIGTGVIILGLTLVRYLNGLAISGFLLVLGILALGMGFADLPGFEFPVFPVLVIIAGAVVLLKAFSDKK